ncbi:damage-control phosphatase ARMT1-like isoform X2 [Lycorma delicatula]
MRQSVQEDAAPPLNIPLCAKYMRSFAYKTMKDRLPIILTKIIDGLVREKENVISCHGEKAREELKKVIGYISQLKNELQTDKPFTELSLIGTDAEIWNKHLKDNAKEIGVIPSYFQTDWMYAECYIYRRLQEAFLNTESLKKFDPFHWQKKEALDSAMRPIKSLAVLLNNIVVKNSNHSKDEIKNNFICLLKIALWGNKCDLSLSCGGAVSVDDNPLSMLKQYDHYMLVDDSEDVWKTLADCKGSTVDIILDNAGFELVTDLCLAEYLIVNCDIAKVRFRAKMMPWYVSDVMVKDFHYVINTLAEHQEPFSNIGNRWLNYVNQGKFEILADQFWTLPLNYYLMEKVDKELYDDLKSSKLLIFKGDLNYRKLVGDVSWPTTCPFKNALRGFHPAPLVSLRTLKADVVVGLRPGQAEETAAKASDWMLTGDFAVIQYDSEKHFS